MWSRVGGRTRSLLAAGLRALGPPLGGEYYERLDEFLLGADVAAGFDRDIGPALAKRGPYYTG